MAGLKSLFIIIAIVCTNVLTPGANAKPPRKIVGGSRADIETFKMTVAVELGVTHQTCGGTLIGDRWVLTAAHCIAIRPKQGEPYMNPMEYINVKSGSSNRRDIDKVLLSSVCNVNVHKKFLQRPWLPFGDIAVLTLCEPIKFGATRGPASLPDHQYRVGDKGFVLGWGWTEPNDSLSVDILKKAPMTITDVDDDYILAIGNSGDAFCNGDSGGPLLINSTIVGIVSNSPDCTGNTRGFYTNVYAFKEFINDVMKYGGQSVFSGYVKTAHLNHGL